MRYLYILCVLAFCSIYSASGQDDKGKLSGKVLSAEGKPAVGISVLIKNTPWGQSTKEGGDFSMTAPAGTYTLLVQGVGYQQISVPVTVKSNQTTFVGAIVIQEKSESLDDVVVTGQFTPQSVKNSVYQVRTISHEQIRLRGATNVQTILNTELGMRFSNDLTLGTSDVQLMGMSGQNVKVLLDGVPMVDRGSTRESIGQIDINTIDRIEIVEGPMSVNYGSDALAGVINIITKKGRKRC
ncbi:TonB-dependent receptor plug domain-containing protein [Pseudarcicella hirudinis]|uniref:TonB-dependent receptor n=1 Tax=Pseudarcicella hirudinis TaxID=1079859 RepID=UPI0035ED05A3